jgi:hypothetical protein
MSDTVLYAAEVAPDGGEAVHVLGYQNKVANRARGFAPLARLRRWLKGATGNAMILAFPSVPASMTAANVVDTKDCPGILQDMAKALDPPELDLSPPPGFRGAIKSIPEVQVFSTGIYTVVLATNAQAIPGSLHRVPAEKRPALNPALFDAYAAWYPEWTIALCCFNNRKATLATPLLWWYRPMAPERLFLPALDYHTGAVPDLDSQVRVDHVLAVGSTWAGSATRVFYSDRIPEAVKPYFTERVIGARYRQRMPNGDFVCHTDDVRAGKFKPERVKPPGACPRKPLAVVHG